ncbi:alkaline phosphatase D family protein [Brevundimonas sp. 2R-24]|uniref:Alkaline phosphatase D family protein n=1 Tax=Peiella sedimenti TaxID=3061083 RepID=A0ABT8SN29_9CAUL|nr:alkaline phosphatase D family protein [Caulobacteraceae bacterium XZ-24]
MTMTHLDRRSVLAAAAAMGATAMFAGRAHASSRRWREDRTLYPYGVASGDPDPNSVILWTRRAFDEADQGTLHVEIALDPEFRRVISTERVVARPESDWTVRVLASGLEPATVYWYRFTDDAGAGSRIGRTITAPREDDPRPRQFAFASCQSVNEGKQNAYARLIWDDQRKPEDQRLGFMLHLGDFIYEVMEYPDEVPTRLGRTVYEVARLPDARKIGNFYVPTTLTGYRMTYRGHIIDPDIQDARAYLPFVCIGDNHEFSWLGHQAYTGFGSIQPAMQLKVAANQAWWEYIPSRVKKASGPGLDAFEPPAVENTPSDNAYLPVVIDEPNNLAAINSMIAYRKFRYGKNIDVIITDLHSYRGRWPTQRRELARFGMQEFPADPQEMYEAIDAGRAYDGGNPPDEITYGPHSIPNFRKDEPPMSVLGETQKQWLKDALASSQATWKVWAITNGPLLMRMDMQNLPEGMTPAWPGRDFGVIGSLDFSGAFHERNEMYQFVRDQGLTGFVTVSGDRHSFWAGYATDVLPPRGFEPVGLSFITGSISSPGGQEAYETTMARDYALRPIFLADTPGQERPDPVINMTYNHGVRTALEYSRSFDLEAAKALSNPDLSPHLTFVDVGGHGFSIVRATEAEITTEFVCIPHPKTRAETPDGGPIRYRVQHRAQLWGRGERPRMTQEVLEGDARFST